MEHALEDDLKVGMLGGIDDGAEAGMGHEDDGQVGASHIVDPGGKVDGVRDHTDEEGDDHQAKVLGDINLLLADGLLPLQGLSGRFVRILGLAIAQGALLLRNLCRGLVVIALLVLHDFHVPTDKKVDGDIAKDDDYGGKDKSESGDALEDESQLVLGVPDADPEEVLIAEASQEELRQEQEGEREEPGDGNEQRHLAVGEGVHVLLPPFGDEDPAIEANHRKGQDAAGHCYNGYRSYESTIPVCQWPSIL